MALLEIQNLTKKYDKLIALSEISLIIKRGEKRALIGPNGAGKSTLLNLIMGQETASSGHILCLGKTIQTTPINQRARLGIARLMQSPSVFPSLTLFENMLSAVHENSGWLKYSNNSDSQVDESLKRVGLIEKRDQIANNLSHGETKLLDLGMALASQPKLLLLDEPMAGLSESERERVLKLLNSIKDVSLLFIEHNMRIALELADQVSVLHEGKLLIEGTPEKIRHDKQVQNIYLKRENSHA
jgi:branched-chain amino acid transport system ATP-binding protein